ARQGVSEESGWGACSGRQSEERDKDGNHREGQPPFRGAKGPPRAIIVPGVSAVRWRSGRTQSTAVDVDFVSPASIHEGRRFPPLRFRLGLRHPAGINREDAASLYELPDD